MHYSLGLPSKQLANDPTEGQALHELGQLGHAAQFHLLTLSEKAGLFVRCGDAGKVESAALASLAPVQRAQSLEYLCKELVFLLLELALALTVHYLNRALEHADLAKSGLLAGLILLIGAAAEKAEQGAGFLDAT